MTLALKPKPTFGQTTATDHDVKAHIAQLGAQAKAAARQLATATDVAKSAALNAAAKALLARSGELLAANAQDLLGLEGRDMTAAFIDRLTLTEAGIHAMADAMVAIAAQDDPVGRVLARFDRPNGLVIERVSVPIGVIAMI